MAIGNNVAQTPVAQKAPSVGIAAKATVTNKAIATGDSLQISNQKRQVCEPAQNPQKLFGKQLLLVGTCLGGAALIGGTVYSLAMGAPLIVGASAIGAGAAAIGLLGLIGYFGIGLAAK